MAPSVANASVTGVKLEKDPGEATSSKFDLRNFGSAMAKMGLEWDAAFSALRG